MQDRSAETWMSGPTEETGKNKPASKRQNSEDPCLKLWTARNMNPWAPGTYLSSQQCVLRDSQTRW